MGLSESDLEYREANGREDRCARCPRVRGPGRSPLPFRRPARRGSRRTDNRRELFGMGTLRKE
jgi:hypothetical protein